MSNGNLDFIEELGIGQEPNATDTEPKQEENIDQENDSTNESFVQDSETDSDTNENTSEDTDPKASEMEELRKMVEGMEKRIADKDEYIEKLRQESQAKETNNEALEDVVDDEEDFWDNPVEKFNELKQTIQIQQMQIQETIYANTVEGYWDTVNQDALKEAVATDTEFANTFNSSREPYKVAYEYLSAKKEQSKASEQSLREKIREEERQRIMEEMKKGSNKETVPSMKNIGSNSGSSNKASEDGFASYFGSM
jgi:DNA repair exonuclease SbcCD ATPase subunit